MGKGQSLLPSFNSSKTVERTIIWEHFRNAAIRQGKWKLVKLRFAKSGKKAGEWELYDIENDRSEMNNLADKYPEKVAALSALWEKHAHRTLIYPKPGNKKKK